MAEQRSGSLGYSAGPNDEMTKEIGQIVINHSLCESAIFHLFMALLEAPPENVRILVHSQNMKTLAMTKTIGEFLIRETLTINPLLPNRIVQALSEYKIASEVRNRVCHWQWSATQEPIATLTNDFKFPLDMKPVTAKYAIFDLKNASVGLIGVWSILELIAGLIVTKAPPAAVNLALGRIDSIIQKVRAALLNFPEPSTEEPT